ncbi:MAG: hypothetical protein COB59_03760 [Rhodospirillaceae bacterium]|nr:MAG: hypothetical protein COB59_03760 [Rhodospirillaceae bacterium]
MLLLSLIILHPNLAEAKVTACGGDGQDSCVTAKATKTQNASNCPKGSFLDIGLGTCWSCPKGYSRYALSSVKAINACIKGASKKYSKAKKKRKNSYIAQGCPKGQFWDVYGGNGLLGACYNCASGYKRTGTHVNNKKSCAKRIKESYKKASKKGSFLCPKNSFFDPRKGGECWSCPSKFNRNANPVTSDKSCTAKKACNGTNVEARGKCYAKGQCGGNGERPCMFWEQIPSCNKGLGEDFVANKCVSSGTPFLTGLRSLIKVGPALKKACRNDTKLYKFFENDFQVKAPDGAGRNVGICASEVTTGITCGPIGIIETLDDLVSGGESLIEDLSSADASAFKIKVDTQKMLTVVSKRLVNAECTSASFKGTYAKAKKTKALFWVDSFAGKTCAKGSFWDPIDGGGCYSCPKGMNRTAFSSVTSPTACAKSGAFEKATMCSIAKVFTGDEPDFETTQCVIKILGSPKSMKRIEDATNSKLPWKEMCVETGEQIYQIATGAGLQKMGKKLWNSRQAKAKSSDKEIGKIKAFFKDKMAKAKTKADKLTVKKKFVASMYFYRAARLAGPAAQMAAVTYAEAFSAEMDQVCEFKASKTVPNKPTRKPKPLIDLKGAASDIGAGGSAIWKLDTQKTKYGYGIHRLNAKNGWDKIPGAAVRLAVDPTGAAWVVNAQNTLFHWNIKKNNWDKMINRTATDIGVGQDGTVWVIGTDKANGGFGIYRQNKNGKSWAKIPGSATRIDVDDKGNAWIVNSISRIFRYTGKTWERTPGAAIDVAIGPKGRIYVAGTNHVLYQWDGKTWIKVKGSKPTQNLTVNGNGQILSVGPKGNMGLTPRPK